ncbi:MAG: nucleoside triphosphate pyrophosphohydrolase [Timaviella obliquedivisa GSE-PSE-MK23-08B]|nr:nucleoside triphosphate pyrophosphohydrolase [Timaviella obliquedivisa GSE-PSE-MK23-08B]
MTEVQRFLPSLQRLVEVVAQLRSPIGGCPWDLEQTPETLIPYVLEEAYEVVDAIRQGEPEAITDELGDLLLQVVLQAQIASETGAFDLGTVVEGITEKLVRRHPHVFAEVQVDGVEEVRQNWEEIKGAEATGKAQTTTDRLAQYGRSLPPMMAAMKISKKAAAVGFEWENVEGVWAKFHEELAELEAAIREEPKENQQAELGDLLFTIVNLARWYGLDPDEGLRGTNERFVRRFEQVERAISSRNPQGGAQMGGDRRLADYSLEELEALWQEAKLRLSS